MARVNVDQVALTDGRFARLAQLRGWADADHARGKMLLVWNETIHRGAELPVWLIDHHLGAGGAGDLLVAELATLVTLAGEVAGVPAGGTILRIKGCAGRSDYLEKKLNTAIAGGKARAASAQRAAGRFTSQAHQPPAGKDTSAHAPAPAPDNKKKAEPPAQPSLGLEPKPPAIHQPAVAAFHEYFRGANGGTPPTWDDTTIAMMKTLVGKHTCAEVVRRIEIIRTAPPVFPPPPWDLKTLVGNFDKCAQPSSGARPTQQPRVIPSRAGGSS